MNSFNIRSSTLENYKIGKSEKEELLNYNQNVFEWQPRDKLVFPLEPEPHLKAWQQYLGEAGTVGAYRALKSRLVQFQFPICAGIGNTEEYRAATRRGQRTEEMKTATGLLLSEPDQLKLLIHDTLAGPIPVIIAGNRPDFVTLIQALTKHNEPVAIPDSMGACIVGGYNNWDRVREYRQKWLEENSNSPFLDWSVEFKELISQKQLYQDRFIILSPGFYSNVPPHALGLSEGDWLSQSLTIRLEHECTHYFTRRVFGSMRNNILDELIADYQGIVAVLGYFRAEWFLNFVGLESFPLYRQGGRLENYRGNPPLSDGAFKILQILVKQAAENLEDFEQQYNMAGAGKRSLKQRVSMLMALTSLTLEELASNSLASSLESRMSKQEHLFTVRQDTIA